jgi:hypothetical protein
VTPAPRDVAAHCAKHRSDVGAVLLRSLDEIAARFRDDADARATRTQIERCARAIEMWSVVAPSDEQVRAMKDLVADLQNDEPVSGLRPMLPR